MDMFRGNTNRSTQSGMVSILVTMIMMIVITLIIIGISQVTRSNQREQLNSQLSTQAYYAAESGLNQAVRFFNANPSVGLDTSGNCTQFITNGALTGLGGAIGTTNVLDSASNVSYTCLMVNSKPTSLQKAPLTQDSSTVWHVSDAGGAASTFTQLELKWKSNSSTQFTGLSNTCSAAGFPAYKSWKCAFGILRVDLVDVHGTVATSANAGLESQSISHTLYLVPTYSAGGVGIQSLTSFTTDSGKIVNVSCNAATSLCDIKLTPLWVASNDYFVRLSMIYQDSDSVTLTGVDTGGVAHFSGGQAVIDVTGKAQDELRRVQARVPLNVSTVPIPNFGLQSTGDICKQLSVAPGLNTLDTCP